MSRLVLAVASAVLVLAATGCGGGSSASSTPGIQQVPRGFARQLSTKIELQMAQQLHAPRFRVRGIQCEGLAAGITHCELAAADGRGHNGAIQITVTIAAGGSAQVQVNNVTNAEWITKLNNTRAKG